MEEEEPVNEVKEIDFFDYGFGYVKASATRRKNWDDNAWHVNVTFGDGGYEVEPGVYLESKEEALDRVEKTIIALGEIRKWLKEDL